MQININYMAQLKKAAGIPRETVAVETPCTVQKLITESVCPHRKQLCEMIHDPDGAFRSILLVFVGDNQVDLETPFDLRDNDDVTIMFPIAGG